ncbi:hypothetical protein GCM10010124_26610 [Pilimelia terevasa]|uniref:Uncharacterized protein n=1 Tax=Pilimelia terevasa TaxID=53372 RepID=A0A8J3BT45_9ACTN|nr:hypothetical protein [Pilimelia terevasa]GGK32501.1 hypothetical protein GCM10010124_26610 [Pilimelia terevasa]
MTSTLLATLTLLAVAGGYGLVCWLWPFGTCSACSGAGARPHLITRNLRICRRCRGAGKRLRTGRAMWNYGRRIHHDATTSRDAR